MYTRIILLFTLQSFSRTYRAFAWCLFGSCLKTEMKNLNTTDFLDCLENYERMKEKIECFS